MSDPYRRSPWREKINHERNKNGGFTKTMDNIDEQLEDLEKSIKDLEMLKATDEDEYDDEYYSSDDDLDFEAQDLIDQRFDEAETGENVDWDSYQTASEDYKKSLEGHEGERNQFGTIIKAEIDPRDETPNWMANLSHLGRDYDPQEIQIGKELNLKYTTDNPTEAEQIARTKLDELRNYWTELKMLIDNALTQAETDRKVLKALDIEMLGEVEPPKGMAYDPVFRRLIPVSPGEIKKSQDVEEYQVVMKVERQFRKAHGLESPEGINVHDITEKQLQKALVGEIEGGVYGVDEDNNIQLVKAQTEEEAEGTAKMIRETQDEEERWERSPNAPVLRPRKRETEEEE